MLAFTSSTTITGCPDGDVTYASLKDGTNRVTKSAIDVPAKQLKVLSESGDFVKPEN
jgi:hypothetical protein